MYLLGLLGVDPPTALGMSLLRQAIRYAYAALGAILFLRWSSRPTVSELQALSDDPIRPATEDHRTVHRTHAESSTSCATSESDQSARVR